MKIYKVYDLYDYRTNTKDWVIGELEVKKTKACYVLQGKPHLGSPEVKHWSAFGYRTRIPHGDVTEDPEVAVQRWALEMSDAIQRKKKELDALYQELLKGVKT